MCVIICVLKGSRIPTLHTLRDCWDSNPNGAGFMYPGTTPEGKPSLKIVKQLMSFSALKKKLQLHRDDFMDKDNLAIVDFAVHFRIASVGGAVPHLTHPFHTGEASAIMHNGHISSLAYDPVTLQETGAAPRESKGRQQALGCFRDEEGDFNCLDDLPDDPFIVANDQVLYLEWIEAVMKRNDCTRIEAIDIVERCVDSTTFKDMKQPNKPIKPKAPPAPAESDTSRLATILSRLPKGWQRNEVCHYLIDETFLGSDRLVIFDHKGLCKIIGEKHGTWEGGMWASNTYWKSRYIVSGKDLDKKTNGSVSTSAYGVYKPGETKRWEGRNGTSLQSPMASESLNDTPAGAPSLPPGAASEPDVIRELPSDMPEYGGWP